jgi:amidophosphoribosyltransferase
MMRDRGAKEVHFRVASPPVVSPCYYGMDFPSTDELIANKVKESEKDEIAEIANMLQVDSLRYISVDGLLRVVKNSDTPYDKFCQSCFTKTYNNEHEMMDIEDFKYSK